MAAGPAVGGDALGGIASDGGGDGTAAGSPGGASTSGGSTSTASGGDDGSGVGSGGTGVSTADATGVGSVDGAGSIIVNGLRYDTSQVTGSIQDAPNGLQLGMTAKVIGPVNADFTQGVARWVESAADMRGVVDSVDLVQGSFSVLGTRVTTDSATVWADVPGLASLAPGQTVQVWGLPGAPGVLYATRIEQRPPSSPILVGIVQKLDAAARTFTLGGLIVDYSRAAPDASVDGQPLTNGSIVRVRADAAPAGGILAATQLQWWYPVPRGDGTTAQIAGIVTDFAGLGSFRLLGIPVDASTAQITGGPVGAIGNGVKVDVGGVVTGGVLRASKLKIRNVPGTGGPASFDLTGTVGAFRSPADFRVRGQPVDATQPGVVFVNGTPANLGNGTKVHVHGTRVVNGVLLADLVSFQ